MEYVFADQAKEGKGYMLDRNRLLFINPLSVKTTVNASVAGVAN